jgi:hypothetical protein
VPTEPTGGLYSVVFSEGVPQNDLNFGNTQPVVLDRALFYNDSKYDGHTAGIDIQDSSAIASDKQAYFFGEGPSTFANLSSYTKGINGLFVDIFGAHPNITADDFSFHLGNDESPAGWTPAPDPIAVAVLPGAGVSGSDRVAILWAPGAIQNTWLEVQVTAGADTGLADPDVFYFGHALGDTGLGDTATHALVNATDELGTRNNPASLFSNVPLTNVFDFNRDGAVNVSDGLVSRNNATSLGTSLLFIELGGIVEGGPPGGEATGAGIALTSVSQAFAPQPAVLRAEPLADSPAARAGRATLSAPAFISPALARLSHDELVDWLIELDDTWSEEMERVG